MVVTTDEVWPLVGRKMVKLPPSASMSLVVTVAMPRVRAHLKLLAYTRDSYLGGCLTRGGSQAPKNASKAVVTITRRQNALPAMNAVAPMSMVDLGW